MNHYARMKRRALPAAMAAVTLGLMMSHATAADLTKIRMITSPQLPWPYGWELVEVADAKGFFEKQGLELERVSLPPDQYSAAMESGRTDFTAYADYAYLINLVDKGVPVIEVVASSLMIDENIAGDGVFVKADSPIKSAADLKGKTIGMLNVAFSSAWFTSEYLGKNGVSKDDVKYVNVPTGQQEQVLTSGDVDAMYVYGPLDAIFRTRPNEFRQLFKLSDLTGGPNIRGGTMALVSFAKEHPDIVRKYAAAIGEAANWANQNQAEVVQIMVDRGRVDPKLAAATYNPKGEADYSALRWPENGAQKEADVQFWLSLLEAQGIIEKGRLKPSDIYTNEFVNTAN